MQQTSRGGEGASRCGRLVGVPDRPGRGNRSHGAARTRSFRAAVATFPPLLLALLGACVTWKPTTTPLPALLAREPPDRVRLSVAHGRTLELRYPRIAGDSVVEGPGPEVTDARREKASPSKATGQRAVALGDVASVSIRRTNVMGTLGLLALGVAGTILVIFIHDCAGGCGGLGR